MVLINDHESVLSAIDHVLSHWNEYADMRAANYHHIEQYLERGAFSIRRPKA